MSTLTTPRNNAASRSASPGRTPRSGQSLEELKKQLMRMKKALERQKESNREVTRQLENESRRWDNEKKEFMNRIAKMEKENRILAKRTKDALQQASRRQSGSGNINQLKFQVKHLQKMVEKKDKKAFKDKKEIDRLKAMIRMLNRQLAAQGRMGTGTRDRKMKQLEKALKIKKRNLKEALKDMDRMKRFYERQIAGFKSKQDRWIKQQKQSGGRGQIIKYVFLDDVRVVKIGRQRRDGTRPVKVQMEEGETTLPPETQVVLPEDAAVDQGPQVCPNCDHIIGDHSQELEDLIQQITEEGDDAGGDGNDDGGDEDVGDYNSDEDDSDLFDEDEDEKEETKDGEESATTTDGNAVGSNFEDSTMWTEEQVDNAPKRRLKERVRELQNEVRDLKEQVKDMNGLQQETQRDLTLAEERMQEQHQRDMTQQKEMQEHIEELMDQVTKARANKLASEQALKTDLAAARIRADELEQQMNEMETELENEREQMARKLEEAELANDTTALQEQNESLQARNNDLQEELSAAKSEMRQLREQLENAEDEREQMQAQLQAQQQMASQPDEQQNARKEFLKQLREIKKQHREELAKKDAALRTIKESLESELEHTHLELEEAKRLADERKENPDEMEAQNSATENQSSGFDWFSIQIDELAWRIADLASLFFANERSMETTKANILDRRDKMSNLEHADSNNTRKNQMIENIKRWHDTFIWISDNSTATHQIIDLLRAEIQQRNEDMKKVTSHISKPTPEFANVVGEAQDRSNRMRDMPETFIVPENEDGLKMLLRRMGPKFKADQVFAELKEDCGISSIPELFKMPEAELQELVELLSVEPRQQQDFCNKIADAKREWGDHIATKNDVKKEMQENGSRWSDLMQRVQQVSSSHALVRGGSVSEMFTPRAKNKKSLADAAFSFNVPEPSPEVPERELTVEEKVEEAMPKLQERINETKKKQQQIKAAINNLEDEVMDLSTQVEETFDARAREDPQTDYETPKIEAMSALLDEGENHKRKLKDFAKKVEAHRRQAVKLLKKMRQKPGDARLLEDFDIVMRTEVIRLDLPKLNLKVVMKDESPPPEPEPQPEIIHREIRGHNRRSSPYIRGQSAGHQQEFYDDAARYGVGPRDHPRRKPHANTIDYPYVDPSTAAYNREPPRKPRAQTMQRMGGPGHAAPVYGARQRTRMEEPEPEPEPERKGPEFRLREYVPAGKNSCRHEFVYPNRVRISGQGLFLCETPITYDRPLYWEITVHNHSGGLYWIGFFLQRIDELQWRQGEFPPVNGHGLHNQYGYWYTGKKYTGMGTGRGLQNGDCVRFHMDLRAQRCRGEIDSKTTDLRRIFARNFGEIDVAYVAILNFSGNGEYEISGLMNPLNEHLHYQH